MNPPTPHLAGFATLAFFCAALFAGAGNAAPFMEPDTDRRLGDMRVMEMDDGGPLACYNACVADGECKSWTWAHATENRPPLCYTKSTVARAENSPCCVSGVIIGSGAPGAVVLPENR